MPPFVLLGHVRALVEATPSAASDRDLLHRFARHRDEDAFAVLLRRHGPMVLRVCRRFLAVEADAEDAFQTVFVTLARKAGAVRWRDSAAGWLYGVACRAARKVRLAAARRRRHELAGAIPRGTDPLAEMSARELLSALDEALTRLPGKYRDPLVLYYLEGMTREEVAERLGCPLGTLKGRVERGKERLHAALERRGLSLSVLLAAALVGRGAAVPQALARAALRAAVLATPAAAVGPVGAVAVALVLMIGLVAARAAWTVSATPAAPAEEPAGQVADKPIPGGDVLGDPLPEGAITRLGTSRLRTGRHHLFLPDSRRFVQSREDGSVEISDVKTGKPLARPRASDVPGRKHILVSTAAASPDSKHLAAVCWEGRCGIWETATGRLVRWLESGGFYSIVQCDFSPDGKWVAVGGRPAGPGILRGAGAEDYWVGVYDVESGRQLFKAPGTNSVFAPDGRSLVTWDGYRGGGNQIVRCFAVSSGKPLSELTCFLRLPDFSPPTDGTSVFEVTKNNAIQLRTVATGEVKHAFRGPAGGDAAPVHVRHVPNRRELIVVATNPAGIWCWDKGTGKELWKARLAAKAYHVDLSRDGKVLAVGDTAGTVRVLDATTGGERASFKPATIGHATRPRVSPDGTLVATTSGGYFTMAIAFWDAATGKPMHGLPGHAASITAAAFTPDGAGVYTVGLDRALRAWDAEAGQERWRAPADAASFLAVSGDGKSIYAAGPDGGMVQVLNARTGKSERRFPAFAHTVAGLALTRDGTRLVVAGRDSDRGDSLVRILDARSGEKLRDWAATSAKVEQLAMRPNGETVATTHVGQRILLWDGRGKRVLEQVGRGERVSVRDRVRSRLDPRHLTASAPSPCRPTAAG
jgi:RNA polymerase sigma factor (sigma-70 family)